MGFWDITTSCRCVLWCGHDPEAAFTRTRSHWFWWDLIQRCSWLWERLVHDGISPDLSFHEASFRIAGTLRTSTRGITSSQQPAATPANNPSIMRSFLAYFHRLTAWLHALGSSFCFNRGRARATGKSCRSKVAIANFYYSMSSALLNMAASCRNKNNLDKESQVLGRTGRTSADDNGSLGCMQTSYTLCFFACCLRTIASQSATSMSPDVSRPRSFQQASMSNRSNSRCRYLQATDGRSQIQSPVLFPCLERPIAKFRMSVFNCLF